MFLNCRELIRKGVIVLFFVQIASSSRAQDSGIVSVEVIVACLEARQQRFETGKFEVNEKVTIPKESIRITPGFNTDSTVEGSFPPETVTNPITRVVFFSKDFLRYSYEGPTWNQRDQNFVPQSYITVNNADESKSFFGNAYGKHPLGFLHDKKDNMDAANLRAQPVLRHFRPFHSSMGRMSPSNFVLRGLGGEVDGYRCVIVDQKSSGFKESFWMDSDRNFIVLRIQNDFNGRALQQVDISYSSDKDHGWIPSAWRGFLRYSYDGGKTMELKESFEAKVTDYKINFPYRPEDFVFTFPVGTLVEDQRTKKGYIVRDNNQKRMITDKERTPDIRYSDLLNSETGMAVSEPGNWLRHILLFLIPVCCLGVWWYKKRRTRLRKSGSFQRKTV